MAQQKRKTKTTDLDFEISFFEGVLTRLPQYIPALVALGDAYTKRGDLKKGLETDLRLSELRHDDSVVHYNLACSYSLLGLIDDSLRALKKSVMLGYEDFEYLQRDPDLENLRKDSRFQHFLQELKGAL